MNDPLGLVTPFEPSAGKTGRLVSLPALETQGLGKVSRLPVTLRVVPESVARNVDGHRVTTDDVRALAAWEPRGDRSREIPFTVARVLLQDFTGVPLLVDLAAMRAAVARLGKDPLAVEPIVPVDLVIDHSVQVDVFATADALRYNMDREMDRNLPRYEFLKWGTQAFRQLRIVPPGVGICHQVNLEYLARGVLEKDGLWFPDTLVGTDSHTTMIAGLGVLGWGVGGIEAEAAMLGQPYYFATPDVIGFHLAGALREGVTATDLVLRITEVLRKAKVVGKLVEFFGEGAERLPVPERATISNMSPEYGATVGYFPLDGQSIRYLRQTGRPAELVSAVEAYHRAQGLFGMPRPGQLDYTDVVELDLSTVRPSVAGPKRPQDRIDLPALKETFRTLFAQKDAAGYGKDVAELGQRWRLAPAAAPPVVPGGGLQDSNTVPDGRKKNTSTVTETEMMDNRPTPNPVRSPPRTTRDADGDIGHGDVLIASITSCTNTSNPGVMLAAGLLARKAVEKGLRVKAVVKTSLGPGSRVVTRYFERTGLQKDLDALGFQTVGYGCLTCIGNSGPLEERIEKIVTDHDVVGASVLSGNRNFEARVHGAIRANFLMSPPLVVAFAIAGRVDVDLEHEPLGKGKDGKDVFLRDVWPTMEEVEALRDAAADPEEYRRNYADLAKDPRWNALPVRGGKVYDWNAESTYIQQPSYFTPFDLQPGEPKEVTGARALAIFGDSVTTDHISPAGSIKPSSPAGIYLQQLGITVGEFNTYGARRGNHHVMVRGTFANVRIKNLMVPGVEGGVTIHQPTGRRLPIHDAALEYARDGVPLCIIAGQEYGTGSSRDWAAKGPALLGVRFVVARSFERIHRSNLVGMGVLPCQFAEGVSAQGLGLDGSETFDLLGVGGTLRPRQTATLVVHRTDGRREDVTVTVRIDTPIEVEYYRHGGIMPYVLRGIVKRG
jgi:aconitate hydratase